MTGSFAYFLFHFFHADAPANWIEPESIQIDNFVIFVVVVVVVVVFSSVDAFVLAARLRSHFFGGCSAQQTQNSFSLSSAEIKGAEEEDQEKRAGRVEVREVGGREGGKPI